MFFNGNPIWIYNKIIGYTNRRKGVILIYRLSKHLTLNLDII